MSELVGIVGSRVWANEDQVFDYIRGLPAADIIVSGGCPTGADNLAFLICKKTGRPILIFFPDYETLPKHIAPIARNTKIAATCDRLVAFWDGKSGGTRDTILKAQALGKPVSVIGPLP